MTLLPAAGVPAGAASATSGSDQRQVVVAKDSDGGAADCETPLLPSSSSSSSPRCGSCRRRHYFPPWIDERQDEWGERLSGVAEWDGGGGAICSEAADECGCEGAVDRYRQKHGWKGRDLIHDPRAPVRVEEYFVKFGNGDGLMDCSGGGGGGGIGTTLTGICRFTDRAESHRGFCHGGSMTSVVDDAVGWCAFCVTGRVRPWSGFTVQVSVNLRRPVPVNSVLLVVASVVKIERRKVFVEVKLVDPAARKEEAYVVHAKGEGMVVLNRGVLSPSQDDRGRD